MAIVIGATGLVSCSSAAPTEVRTGNLVWRDCGAIQCTTLSVPLDWAHPAGTRIDLSLARRPATGSRLGVLLTNPGGPGGSGIELVQAAAEAFDPTVRERFDIVSWDPRGVGASAPADCTPNLDYFYAVNRNGTSSATATANAAVAKQFVTACVRGSHGLLAHLSTPETVRDMDAIRAAMGAHTIDYLGFSYGTYIGSLYAKRYPSRVRAMVLDGAIDPALSYADATLTQAVGFEKSLNAFFSWCESNSACVFARGADPRKAYDALMSSLASETDPATVAGESRSLGAGEANIGVATALYGGRDGWDPLARALNDAAQGDGTKLLTLSDSYTGRHPGGTYDNQTAAFYAIGCLDGPAPPTLARARQLAIRAARVAPRFGASTVWLGLPCTYWPVPAVTRPGPVRAPTAPKIVVVGNTDDPATPYAQAQALTRELGSAQLLTYVGEGHTAYGRGDACIDTAVDHYLISRVLPPAGERCS